MTRVNEQIFLAEAAGSTRGDVIACDAWRGRDFKAGDLRPSKASFSWSTSRQVQGDASFTFADPSGVLWPLHQTDTLAAYGSELRPSWRSGSSGIVCPLGVWGIDDSYGMPTWTTVQQDDIEEVGGGYGEDPYGWVRYGMGTEKVVASERRILQSGGTVIVRALELTEAIKADTVHQEAPAETSTIAEIRRLIEPLGIAVRVEDGVTDLPVPADLVYDKRDRLDIIEEHLERLSATYRMGPDGSFVIVPLDGVDTGLVLRPGDGEALIDLILQLRSQDVFNHVVAYSATEDNIPLIGHAYIEHGPLAWGGPLRRRTLEYRSSATSQAGVDADARRVLAEQGKGRTLVPIDTYTQPALELHDRIKVVFPTAAGLQEFTAPVTDMSFDVIDGVPDKEMSLTVAVATEELARIGRVVNRARRFVR